MKKKIRTDTLDDETDDEEVEVTQSTALQLFFGFFVVQVVAGGILKIMKKKSSFIFCAGTSGFPKRAREGRDPPL